MIACFDLSHGAFRVWQRNRDTFLRLWRTESWPPVVESLLNLLAMGYGIGAYITGVSGGDSYVQFLAPGIVGSSLMFAASFECLFGSYVRMEWQKTFDAIIATPVSIDDVVMGEMLWGATRGLISATGVTLVATALGLITWPASALIIPLAFLASFMFGAMAMIVTSLVPSINAMNYYFTLGITPMFLFSEVFFPTDRFPQWAQQLTLLSPLTHFVRPARALAQGGWDASLLVDVVVLVAGAAVAASAGMLLMRRRLIR